MRGKQFGTQRLKRNRRITPADAGKTVLSDYISDMVKDHPRGCGENITADSNQIKMLGSPPRMRGKRNIIPINKI